MARLKVVIPIEARLTRSPDGSHWVKSPSNYAFWARYLRVFDGVRIVARVANVPTTPDEHDRVDGPGVEVSPLPYFVGVAGFVRNFRVYRKSIRLAIGADDAVILRLPGQASATALRAMGKTRPYGVEIVGDPDSVFAPGATDHRLRPALRFLFTSQLRRAARRASSVAYVTQGTLQARYPSGPGAYTASYSSVELLASDFTVARRPPAQGQIRCITVGYLDQVYKGVDVAIEAIALCRARGLDATLTIVGDGRLRPDLERLAAERGIGQAVKFVGQLRAGAPIRQMLDEADLFVLASRTEGLPRAMIEAMARGLPALGSRVGGIPELLPTDCMFPPGDHVSLSRSIERVAGDGSLYRRLSESCLDKAHEYGSDLLSPRRDAFYRIVRSVTEAWSRSSETSMRLALWNGPSAWGGRSRR